VGIFWETFIVARLNGGGRLPSAAALEHLPERFLIEPDFSRSRSKASRKDAEDKPVKKFQDLRAVVMTKNKRAQAAIPHQGRRNLSCLAWFSSPRGTTSTTKVRREMKQKWRISHGNARAIESLRELRLSLVPHTE
jgi:hypothetical protein